MKVVCDDVLLSSYDQSFEKMRCSVVSEDSSLSCFIILVVFFPSSDKSLW
jgi:hypothetical protein